MPLHAREQLLLDWQVFDDGLDDPVRLGDLEEVVVEVPDLDQLGPRWDEERRRLRMQRPLLARGGEPVADQRMLKHQAPAPFLVEQLGWPHVEQQDWDTRVGEVGGDGAAHDAGAQHRRTPEAGNHIIISAFTLFSWQLFSLYRLPPERIK